MRMLWVPLISPFSIPLCLPSRAVVPTFLSSSVCALSLLLLLAVSVVFLFRFLFISLLPFSSITQALKLAREVDEDGARTLGVVTKADVVQNDSDFLHKMRMDRKHDVKLELGFIAVRNRTPGELAAEPPISHVDVLANEQKLFSGHPLLQQVGDKHV